MVAAGAATLAQSLPCCKLMYNDFTLVQRLMLYGMCASAIIAMHRWVLLMMPWRRLLVSFFCVPRYGGFVGLHPSSQVSAGA